MNIEQFIETMPLSTGCSVIKFDDCGLIAINKKAGRATHPNAIKSANAKPPMLRAKYNLRDEYYSWEDENGEKRRLYLINRLDSPTSGVVLASADPEVAEIAKQAFKDKNVQKTYMAICVGRVGITDKWIDSLISRNQGGHVRSTSAKGGSVAITHCKFVKEDLNKAKLSLVELTPITGLTHQLRVQCAKRKFPILGDATYGNFAFNKKIRTASKINRLFLHCAKTQLKINVNGQEVDFCAEAPLPESFSTILNFNINIAKIFRF